MSRVELRVGRFALGARSLRLSASDAAHVERLGFHATVPKCHPVHPAVVSCADSFSTATRQNNGGTVLDAPRRTGKLARQERGFEDGSPVVIIVGDSGSFGQAKTIAEYSEIRTKGIGDASVEPNVSAGTMPAEHTSSPP